MARWDHVIVGAGSAGCVVARRLAESCASVLLLDAGPGGAESEAITGANFFAACDENGRSWPSLIATRARGALPSEYRRGRGVGGSSSINAMVAIDGLPDDYNRWALPGWSWDDLAPARARSLIPCSLPAPDELGPVDRALASAMVSLGHTCVDDVCEEDVLGVGPIRLTRRNRQRVSSAAAYLDNAPPSLEILPNSLVTRVLFNGTHAIGVELVDGSQLLAANVVVCAGAIHSPALLQRSGVRNDAIGRGLVDHASIAATLSLNPSQRQPSDDCLAIGVIARLSSDLGYNDLQLLSMNHVGVGHDARTIGMIMMGLMDVSSTGRVQIISDDPTVEPRIEFNMLSASEDRQRASFGLDVLLDVLNSKAIRDISSAITIGRQGDGPGSVPTRQTERIEWMKANLGDYVHASGTCRMGDTRDPRSVVDLQGNVIGYENLRVVDASILPRLPRSNTHVPVTIVAEHLAALWTLT